MNKNLQQQIKAKLNNPDILQEKSTQYEARMVKLVLARFGLSEYEKKIRESNKQEYDHDRLDFIGFGDAIDCPCDFRALYIPELYKISVTELLYKFEKTNLYKRWVDFLESEQAGIISDISSPRFMSTIVPFSPIHNMVLHTNHVLPTDSLCNSVNVCYWPWDRDLCQRVYLTPLGRVRKPGEEIKNRCFLDVIAEDHKIEPFSYM